MIKYKSIHVNCPADDPRSADHSPQPAASAASAKGERYNCTQLLLFCLTAETGTGILKLVVNFTMPLFRCSRLCSKSCNCSSRSSNSSSRSPKLIIKSKTSHLCTRGKLREHVGGESLPLCFQGGAAACVHAARGACSPSASSPGSPSWQESGNCFTFIVAIILSCC